MADLVFFAGILVAIPCVLVALALRKKTQH
jgi:hypothetical protein